MTRAEGLNPDSSAKLPIWYLLGFLLLVSPVDAAER